jgi:hypothetical protein
MDEQADALNLPTGACATSSGYTREQELKAIRMELDQVSAEAHRAIALGHQATVDFYRVRQRLENLEREIAANQDRMDPETNDQP